MEQLRPNAERAKKAKNLLLVSVGISAIFLLQSIYEYFQLSSMGDGRSFNIMVYLDKKDPLASLNRISSVIAIVTIVYFIQWFRRAYFNLHQLRNDLRFSESTAAWSWFVPIFNFYAPYLIMRDLISKSNDSIEQNGSSPQEVIKMDLVAAWWFTYIGAVVVALLSLFFVFDLDFSGIKTATLIGLVSQIMNITSGLILVQIITKYTKNELQLAEGKTEIDQIGEE